jgi:hypothetical protein
MSIPFSIEAFMQVFRQYNTAFPLMPPVMYLLGLLDITLAFRRHTRAAGRIICGTLAFFWLWMGAVYHLGYFSAINPAANLFGLLFILQGLLFLYAGTLRGALQLRPERSLRTAVGLLLIIYALIGYPLLGHALGHTYPASPLFGMAPCPTTIFTFGVLLLAAGRVPLTLYMIPFLWALVGLSAAVNLKVYEDFGLTIAGALALALILQGNRRARRETAI